MERGAANPIAELEDLEMSLAQLDFACETDELVLRLLGISSPDVAEAGLAVAGA